MPFRKLDAFITTQPLTTDAGTLGANTPLLCVGVIGGTMPLVIDQDTPVSSPIKLSGSQARTLDITNLRSPAIAPLYTRYVIESEGRTPLVDRDFQEGEIVEADTRIALPGEDVCIPRGHKLICVVADEQTACFRFSHPLEYIEETLSLPQSAAAYVLAPSLDRDEDKALGETCGWGLHLKAFENADGKVDAWIADFKSRAGKLRSFQRPGEEPEVEDFDDLSAAIAECLRDHARPPKFTVPERELVMPESDAAVILLYIRYRLSWYARAMSFYQFACIRGLVAWRSEVIRQREASKLRRKASEEAA